MKLENLLLFCLFVIIVTITACQQQDQVAYLNSSDCTPATTLTTEECQGPTTDTMFTGFKQFYWTNDSTTLKSEGHFTAGVADSIWIFYYSNGDIKETGLYVNNQRSGLWRGYTQLGQLEWTGIFTNCLREGTWQFYHTDGKVKEEGLYEASVRKGTWKYYSNTGKLVTEVKYSC